MSRAETVLLCLWVVLSAPLAALALESRPNIILIMADDLGFECLGAYGSASYQTPALDKLAETGMRFIHCYSQPLCTPSRVQIMTGRYNFRNYTAFGVLPPKEVTFGHVLKKAGYATAIAGKWQLYGFDSTGYQSAGKGSLPAQAGFDDHCLWQVQSPRKAGERYADPLLSRKTGGDAVTLGGYGPNESCEFILDFMTQHRRDPFFIYYPMALTHNPFVPTPDGPGWDGDRYASDPSHFGSMVSYMDKIVSRIVAKLDELDLRENTLVLFTGDNGTDRTITSKMTGGRTITGDKGHPTDAGTRVPLIANWPGVIPSGRVNTGLIDFTDFLPTLAAFAKAELPKDREIDGRSFAPQLRGEKGNPRDWILCDYDPRWARLKPARFARTQRWKLYGDGRFFDVPADPLEASPLAAGSLDNTGRAAWAQLQAVLDTVK